MGNEQSAQTIVAAANQTAMGRPSPSSSSQPPPLSPEMSSSGMARQHERLIVELLPFRTVEQFHWWLESAPVLGSWLEFRANCRHQDLDEVEKSRVSQVARDAINSKSTRYLIYHPDKQGWVLEDHVVRFMVTVVKDAVLQGMWSEGEWRAKGLDIAKAVFEVICFLKAVDEQPSASGSGSEEVAGEHPPDYSA